MWRSTACMRQERMDEPDAELEARGNRLQWGTARANSHGGLSQEGS